MLMTYLHCFLLLIMQINIKEYLSPKHPIINFSIEEEKDGCLPFLDVNIFVKTRNLQLTSKKKCFNASKELGNSPTLFR